MIELVLAHADLARVRFAHSPLRELVASLRTLRDSQRRHVYRRWLTAVAGKLDGVDMPLLEALAPIGPHMYSFLAPHLHSTAPLLKDELEAVAATPPEAISAEIAATASGQPIAEPLRALYQDPATHLPFVLDELTRYWRVGVEPYWEQIRSTVTADIFFRLEQFAAGGVGNVLCNLHSEVSFADDRILVDKRHHCTQRYDLTGQGMVLVPCVFTWPTLVVGCCDVVQPSLTYAPRGIAAIGGEPQGDPPDSLVALVGRTKVSLLASLHMPKTTTQLAKELDISPAAVSQHLKVLKATDMAVSRRRGRVVLYERTDAATLLLSCVTDAGRGSSDRL